MKVLLDTNIIVDFLSKRPVFFNEAEKIISKCRDGEIIGIVAVHTVSTLFYLLKKYVSPETLRDIFYNLFEIIEIGRADKNSVLEALKNTDIESPIFAPFRKHLLLQELKLHQKKLG